MAPHRRACHVHHLQPWGRGGATDLDDLALLCHDCHIWVHEGGHTLQRRPDGTWTTTPDLGDDVGTSPEPYQRE